MWERKLIRHSSRRTPQKWAYGHCTVAIVALSAFEGQSLPGIGVVNGAPKSDVATYEQLSHFVEMAGHQCFGRYGGVVNVNASDHFNEEGDDRDRKSKERLVQKREVRGMGIGVEGGEGLGFVTDTGFAITGDQNAVGIFFWGTMSNIDRRYPDARIER